MTTNKDTKQDEINPPSTPSRSPPSSSSSQSQSPAKQTRTRINPPIFDEAETTSSSGSDSSASDTNSDDQHTSSEAQQDLLDPQEPVRNQPADLRSRVSRFLSKLADEPHDEDENIEVLDDEDVGDNEGKGQLIEIDLALGVLSEQGEDEDDNIRTADDHDSIEESANGAEKQNLNDGVFSDLTSIARRNDTSKQRKSKRKIEEVG